MDIRLVYFSSYLKNWLCMQFLLLWNCFNFGGGGGGGGGEVLILHRAVVFQY